MKKNLLLSLTVSLLIVPTAVSAATTNVFESASFKSSESEMIVAGFLNDIQDSVENVQESVEGTNETTKSTIDAVHGTNDAVGESEQIIKGEDSQESTVIETTDLEENTEGQEFEESESSGNSF